jgi:hypothetical protein
VERVSKPFNKQGDLAQLTGMAAISANDIRVIGNATVLGIGEQSVRTLGRNRFDSPARAPL